MTDERSLHIQNQQFELLQTILDSKKFNEDPHRFNQLAAVYCDGFLFGTKSPLRTAEYKKLRPSAEQGGMQYTRASQEQQDYLMNELPQKLEHVSVQIWENFIAKEATMEQLNQLFFEHYQMVEAPDLVGLYFDGLAQGVQLGLTHSLPRYLTQEDYQRMVLDERERYVDSFFTEYQSNKEFMNNIFKQIRTRVQGR